VPELPVLLAKGQAREYKFNKAVEEAEAEPFIVLHTSGSTGLPKPIVLPHGYYFGIDRQQQLPNINGHPPTLSAFRGHRTLLSMPPFHVSTLYVPARVFQTPT
jgi:acyl-CoA synthetase (AMP-forming)/AMP-acid ligase II